MDFYVARALKHSHLDFEIFEVHAGGTKAARKVASMTDRMANELARRGPTKHRPTRTAT